MTREEFEKMFLLFVDVIARESADVYSYAPSAHLIENCGGYEFELHPSLIVWEKEMICLCSIANQMCCSVECRFWNGSIIIR